MIKEKPKKNIDKKKELKDELLGYAKTALVSFIAAAIFTILLSFHARSEMIKNLYVNKNTRSKFEQQIAQQIVAHSDFTKTLNESNYAICLQVGRLYETAGDYHKAEYAYYLATKKAPCGIYTPYYKLATTLIALEKIKEAEELINSVSDTGNLALIRFKTKAYIVMGDKYYSVNTFKNAANCYEKARYYYSRLKKQDKVVNKAINQRLSNAYAELAGILVKNGKNSDAVMYLERALKYTPDNYTIKYRLAIIYTDLDPIKAVEYFEPLVEKIPQEINSSVYSNALMKAANIEDIKGNGIKAKYYRYKVRSLDLFINQHVIYKDDLEMVLNSFTVRKFLFKYRLTADFKFINNSAQDILKMNTEFVLKHGTKTKYSVVANAADRNSPLFSNGGESKNVIAHFDKNIFTKKELEQYYIDIYVYKDPKYKTFIGTYKVPSKSVYSSK